MKFNLPLLWSASLVTAGTTAVAAANADAQVKDISSSSLRGSGRAGSANRRELLSGGVTGLRLIDTITNQPVAFLTEGAIINLDFLGIEEPNFNIDAVVADPAGDIGSVSFKYKDVTVRKENAAPYSFCGDSGGMFATCSDLGFGVHTVSATPWSEKKAQGTPGASFTVTFAIVPEISPQTDAPTTSPVTSAVTDAPILLPVTDAPVPSGPARAPTVPSPSDQGAWVEIDAFADIQGMFIKATLQNPFRYH